MASPDYLRGLRALCSEQNWLMMCDEVQCGMGRTGTWFGISTRASSRMWRRWPRGWAVVSRWARVWRANAAGLFGPGNHGSTFGGNQLAMAAAPRRRPRFHVVERDRLIANAITVGEQIRTGISAALSGRQGFCRGARAGPDDRYQARPAVRRSCRARAGRRLADQRDGREGGSPLLPPLTFSAEEAIELVARLSGLIKGLKD